MEEIKLESTLEDNQAEFISFNKDADFQQIGVLNYNTDELMATISGYGLAFNFNMELINSVKDVEAIANGMADCFYEIIMDKLIQKKPEIVPTKESTQTDE